MNGLEWRGLYFGEVRSRQLASINALILTGLANFRVVGNPEVIQIGCPQLANA